MSAYQITVDTERCGPVRLTVTKEQVAEAMAAYKSNPSAGLVLEGTLPSVKFTNEPAAPMPLCRYFMTPYARIRATGYDVEIKRGHVGWRVYLVDQQGQRVASGPWGARAEIPRTGSDSVADVNKRLKGRGFRKDSRMHSVLEAFAEYCEQAAGERQ